MGDPTSGNQSKASGLKKNAPNVSSGWVVMLLSGLVAAVIFLFVTSQGSTKYQVLVASRDIPTGQKVQDADFNVAEVNVDQAQLNRLISEKDAVNYIGHVATGPITSGDLVTKSSLRETSGKDGMRRMSLPSDKAHAVNGNIKVGDRVDIIDEESGSFTVTNIEIVSVESSSGGTIGSSSSFAINIAVTAEEAAKVAAQLKKGTFDVVLATGATPVDSAPTSIPSA